MMELSSKQYLCEFDSHYALFINNFQSEPERKHNNEQQKLIKITIEKEIIESIAKDAINIFVRNVLTSNNYLTDAYFDLPHDEFAKVRGRILQILTKNYENIEVFRTD